MPTLQVKSLGSGPSGEAEVDFSSDLTIQQLKEKAASRLGLSEEQAKGAKVLFRGKALAGKWKSSFFLLNEAFLWQMSRSLSLTTCLKTPKCTSC